eukprot:TRINITY_DN8946_c0_g2_i2.p3 TRINITY_DN8946_c0_g2~~TRINITY_DN8946_c0_g2_i2.p3  ORF type:complete len:238 (-),score=40.27 TRINITY_DN8946_c0_g2_i2:501-1214(-)
MSSEEDLPLTQRSKQPIKRAGKVDNGNEIGDVKGATILNSNSDSGANNNSNKPAAVTKPVKEKSVYDKLGQTKPTPSENDPERIFYTSCLEQLPEKEMSKRWCMQHGLLDEEEVQKLLKKDGKMIRTDAAKQSVQKTPGSRGRNSTHTKNGAMELQPLSGRKKAAENKIKTPPAKRQKKTPAAKDPALKPKPVNASKSKAGARSSSRAHAKPIIDESSDEEEDVPLSVRGRKKSQAK